MGCTTTPTKLPRAPEPALRGCSRSRRREHLRGRDEWLGDHLRLERRWHGVAAALGRPELIDDPGSARKDQVANVDAVDDEVSSSPHPNA